MDKSAGLSKTFLIAGSFLAGLGVAAGAFGAHGLRNVLPVEMLTTFETAVRYHIYHSLALLATGLAVRVWGNERSGGFTTAGLCFIVGILLFCGSLYALSITGHRWFGFITPVGGVLFLAGWAALGWTILRTK